MLNVIVTGGSRGLGLAIAATLAKGGYRVIAIARAESEELRVAIEGLGSADKSG
jgi:3-oxoacyl-[acyl-carrier protein] reductase